MLSKNNFNSCVYTCVSQDEVHFITDWLQFALLNNGENKNVAYLICFINCDASQLQLSGANVFKIQYYNVDNIDFPVKDYIKAETYAYLTPDCLVLNPIKYPVIIHDFDTSIIQYDYNNKNVAMIFDCFNLDGKKRLFSLWSMITQSEIMNNMEQDDKEFVLIPPINEKECVIKLNKILNNELFYDVYAQEPHKYFDSLCNKFIQLNDTYIKQLSPSIKEKPQAICIPDDDLYKNHIRQFMREFYFGKNISPKHVIKSNIKFVISTCCFYEEKSLDRLLDSLIASGVPSESILVVSGGWGVASNCVKNGINYHRVTHNSFDYTGLIDVLETDNHSDYWFLLHDTCEVGSLFYDHLLLFPKSGYEHVCIDNKGYTNIGLYSWDFLQKSKEYILRLKDCNKQRAMSSEQFLYKNGISANFGGQLWLMGLGNIYGTDVYRHILYYSGLEVYKYQLNINHHSNKCKI